MRMRNAILRGFAPLTNEPGEVRRFHSPFADQPRDYRFTFSLAVFMICFLYFPVIVLAERGKHFINEKRRREAQNTEYD